MERSDVMETVERIGATLVRRYPARRATVGRVPTQRLAPDIDTVESLWAAYKFEGSSWAREQLIVHYLPLVTAVANRIASRLPSSVDSADLVSYGTFGLIDAIEKYETDREVRFESYASSRIRGAILDELRALDWVPRSVRSKSRAIERAYSELEAELSRRPTQAEVADHMGLTSAELSGALAQVATGSVAALDEVMTTDSSVGGQPLSERLADDDALDPLGEVESQETSHLLARAIEKLTERERLVVVLYYFERRTLAQIGRVLGVTESRVSQIHNAAVGRLRAYMYEAEAA
ncbi:MAG: FliA/WhiG family RNA polymerase sigma factor [Micrococcales bacterium]|nr:FliA/WhiG family RNA polymerase sigma factor [Micrococcales bacterium]MCL2666884.1 FliA/WhiG family RNA polymerase sigma factor [Micrococcales bacterium]